MYLSVVSNFTHNFLNFAQIRPTIKFYYKEKLLLVCGKILPVVELQSSLVIILQIRLFSKGLINDGNVATTPTNARLPKFYIFEGKQAEKLKE